MNRSSKVKGTSATEQFLAIAFVACAFAAGFLVLHKEEIMAGELDQVIASYVSSAKDSVATDE